MIQKVLQSYTKQTLLTLVSQIVNDLNFLHKATPINIDLNLTQNQ